IGKFPELGTLGVGRGADIAVLELQSGVFAYKDAWGAKRMGDKRLATLITVRKGAVVDDREGRGVPEWGAGQGDAFWLPVCCFAAPPTRRFRTCGSRTAMSSIRRIIVTAGSISRS